MTQDRTGEDGRALKLTLIGTFFASIALAGRQSARRGSTRDPMELLLMGLASYRIGRMVAFERVGEPIPPSNDMIRQILRRASPLREFGVQHSAKSA